MANIPARNIPRLLTIVTKGALALGCAAILVALVTTRSYAQADSETAKGSSPFAIYNNGDFDSINPISGNVFVHIPLLSYPQRGHALRLNFNIYYNDKQWYIFNFRQDPKTEIITGSWKYGGGTGGADAGAYVARDQHLDFGQDINNTYSSGGDSTDPYVVTTTTFNDWIRESDGSQHYYADSGNQSCSGNCNYNVALPYGNLYPANDGSGFSEGPGPFSTFPVPMLGPDGLSYSYPTDTGSSTDNYETITDTNGNSITTSSNGWTDSVGRNIPGSYSGPGTSDGLTAGPESFGIDPIPGVPISSVPPQCPAGTSTARQWNVPEPTSSTDPYYLCYASANYHTAFNIDATTGSTAYGNIQEASGTAPNLLIAVVLPNRTMYRLAYDSYLSLAQLTLPTGATISYSWQNLPTRPPNPYGAYGSLPVTRAIYQRVLNPGGGQPSVTTTYHRYYNTQTTNYYNPNPYEWTVVTDSLGNDTEHQIVTSDSAGNTISPADGLVSYYAGCSPEDTASSRTCAGSGVGTLLRYDQHTLQYYGGLSGSGVGSGLSRRTMTLTVVPTATGNLTSTNAIAYVPNYGSCTLNSFSGPSSRSGCYTTGQTMSTSQYDYSTSSAAGNLISARTTTYKWQGVPAYLNANLLTPVQSIVVTDGNNNRVGETDYGYDETGSPSGARGNQTSVTNWLNTGGSPVSHVIYNSQGMPAQTADPLGNLTQISYQCSGSLPLMVTAPYNSSTTVSEKTSYVYDCNSGYLTSKTDPNSITTSYGYDALGRLLSSSIPNTYLQITSSNGDPMPPRVTSTTATGTPQPIITDVFYDGVGQATKTQLTSDPSSGGPATVDITYDALGRTHTVSNAHRNQSSASDGITTYTYDGLGRTVVVAHPDNSNLTTCYSGVSSGNGEKCQSPPFNSSGVWTDSSDELGNTTRRTYDGAGRLTAVTEPGYTVQRGPTCPNASCKGPTFITYTPYTTYSYDALSNLVGVNQQGDGSSSYTPARVRTFS